MENSFKSGDILLFSLPKHFPAGHEQEGERPVIVAAVPKEPVRFPVLIVIPLTTKKGPWVEKNPVLYRKIPKDVGGLPVDSIALIDQVCAVDVRRTKSFLGILPKELLKGIQDGLINLLIS